MEAKEFLNQKRIGLVNKFYYQVLEIKKNGAEPDIPLLMKEVEDFDNFVFRYWHMTWVNSTMSYS
ncbi:MAG: hypothetical protein [Bacteriophage sp.]|jgi:hypothetical protein|nr:MAG: hypothetical protein [Bacteriophage sp.]UVX82379.1 MAG: hypothetical protein [Bacteriophage sp.]UVY14778.1 MAG: hypothetical protein [Bacteriophage sp.]UWF78837.1 MAG: hypothetical protein [Bacteriophage sp.]UWF99037.1 MAG: hypothetical protein [Bacteriophage sp.]